jgi:hypothetical protein
MYIERGAPSSSSYIPDFMPVLCQFKVAEIFFFRLREHGGNRFELTGWMWGEATPEHVKIPGLLLKRVSILILG